MGQMMSLARVTERRGHEPGAGAIGPVQAALSRVIPPNMGAHFVLASWRHTARAETRARSRICRGVDERGLDKTCATVAHSDIA